MTSFNTFATSSEFSKAELQALEFHNASIPALREKLTLHKPKLAIVAPGGGTRGSWMAGAKMGLLNSGLKEDDIETMFGASTSAGNTAYFVSKQLKSCLPIRLDLLTDNSDFLSVNAKREFLLRLVKKRTRLILGEKDIIGLNEHLFDSEDFPRILNALVVVKQFGYNEDSDGSTTPFHLDYKRFVTARTKAIIPLRNIHTGEAQYFSNKDDGDERYIENEEMMFRMLQAAKTPPRIAGGPIEIAGELYDDGSFVDPLSLFHSLLSDDGKSIKNNVLPIVLLPNNIFKPIKAIKRKINKTVVNILDGEQLGSTYDVGESIYSKESLQALRTLAGKGEIILPYNTGDYVRKLNNSRKAIHSAYHSGEASIQAHPFIPELIEYAQQKRS